jgi:hypothetical protein
MCAIDALGMAAMLGQATRIDSVDVTTGRSRWHLRRPLIPPCREGRDPCANLPIQSSLPWLKCPT